MTNNSRPGFRRWLKGFVLKRAHWMITCREFEDFVLSYIDGDLTGRQKSTFEWHLRLCRECRQYLAAYERTIELGRAIGTPPEEPILEDVPEELIKAILDARKQ